MASIVRDPRRGTWSVQWNNGDRWVRRVIVRRQAGWKRGDPMPDQPPEAVTEALETCKVREHEAKLGKEIASKHTIVELLDQIPIAVNVGDTAELAQKLEKSFAPFRSYCLRNGIERLDQISLRDWSNWVEEGKLAATADVDPANTEAIIDIAEASAPEAVASIGEIQEPAAILDEEMSEPSPRTASAVHGDEWSHRAAPNSHHHELNFAIESLETKSPAAY